MDFGNMIWILAFIVMFLVAALWIGFKAKTWYRQRIERKAVENFIKNLVDFSRSHKTL